MTFLILILLPLTVATAASPAARDAFGAMLDKEITKEAPKDLSNRDVAALKEIVTYPGITGHGDDQDKESNPLMKVECITEAIKIRTQMVGATQARSDIGKWQAKLASGAMSEGEYWKNILECKDYCAQIMVDALNCYVQSAARQYRGIFLFDYGVGDYQPQTTGDAHAAGRIHDNERVMTQLVANLAEHADEHVLLEGRASRNGDPVSNQRLSGKRSGAVKAELVRRGVPDSRIHFRWIGEGEPYFRLSLAQLYQIADKFEAFGQDTMNQSVTVYIFTPSKE